jgi:DNA-binding transcriptional regulator YhcF (GntR family)
MRKDWMAWAYSQETVTSPTAMAVLLALAKHADEAGFCFPSVERIGTLARLDPRTVQRQIKALEALGVVRREIGGGLVPKSGDRNQGRASSYQLVDAAVPTVSEAETTPAHDHPRSQTTPAHGHLRNLAESRLPRPTATLTVEGKKVGGGSAHACEHTHASEPARGPTPSAQRQAEDAENGNQPPPPAHQIEPQRLGELLEAACWAAIGRRPNRDDLIEVQAWGTALGLCHADQLEVIREVLPTKPEPGPPDRLKYFSKAMKRLADKLALPPLKITYRTENKGQRANESTRERDQIPAYILLAARGTTD